MDVVKFYFLLFTYFFSTASSAIIIQDNLGPSYLNNGQSVNGSFNLNTVVPKASYDHYVINSASLTFNISDDSDNRSLTNQSIGPYYNIGHSETNWQYDSSKRWYYDNDLYQRNVNRTFTEDGEQGKFSIGDQNIYRNDQDYYQGATAFTSTYTSTTNWVSVGDYCDEGYWFFGFHCTDYDPSYRVDVNNYRDNTTSRYYGDNIYGLTTGLSSLNILDLMDDGMLDFSFTATYGDLYFNSAYLTLDVEVVPEPSILALMGLGLAV